MAPQAATVTLPTYIAYFTVTVPVDVADRDSARATEIVEAYLYHGGRTTGVELSSDYTAFVVTVERAFYGSGDEAQRLLDYQRGRFESGMLTMSAVAFYGATLL